VNIHLNVKNFVLKPTPAPALVLKPTSVLFINIHSMSCYDSC